MHNGNSMQPCTMSSLLHPDEHVPRTADWKLYLDMYLQVEGALEMSSAGLKEGPLWVQMSMLKRL